MCIDCCWKWYSFDQIDNALTDIKGLQDCQNLSHLSLAHNSLHRLTGVGGLPLRYLDLVSVYDHNLINISVCLHTRTY